MKNFLLDILFLCLCIVFIIFAIGSGLGWISSCKQAQMYNRLNGANFTCSDFFWAGEQINQQTQTIKLK